MERPPHHFSVTANFSPHLGETNVVSVTLPGCRHGNEPGWLECEVMRETTVGWQHVAWVDMDDSTPAVDRYGAATNLPHEAFFDWDGRAQVGLDPADHPDVFTGGTNSFHRAMPAVESGEPVPPPFHTLRVRLWNEVQDTVIAEEYRRFYVPQVVRITWDADALASFEEPLYTQGTAAPVLLFACDSGTAQQCVTNLPGSIEAKFRPSANLRVTTQGVLGRHKLLRIVRGTSDSPNGLSFSGENVFRNADPSGLCKVYVRGLRSSVINSYTAMMLDAAYDARFGVPLGCNDMSVLIAYSSVHEVGHELGLVHATLGGSESRHNQEPHGKYHVMNPGDVGKVGWRLEDCLEWKPLNRSYLDFVLP
jgi:hypothetical protein